MTIHKLFMENSYSFTPMKKSEELTLGHEKTRCRLWYTLDSGMLGMLDEETFQQMAQVYFKGISAHPGYVKNKLFMPLKLHQAW